MLCSDGSATNAYADPGPTTVPRSGVIRTHSTMFWDVGAYIKLSPAGTASGHFWALGTLSSGAGCSSGTVTFTARRTHA